jgi:hypothetical protein
MSTLFITGAPGAGKSQLLATAAAAGVRLALVDCLAPHGPQWQDPDRDDVDVVAIDHVTHDRSGGAALREAAAWAARNRRPLWLVDLHRLEIEAVDLPIARDAVELPLPLPLTLPTADGLLLFGILEAHGRRFIASAWPECSTERKAGTRRGLTRADSESRQW